MIFTPSNILSLIRGPLAFLFLWDSTFIRAIALLLAMITDCLDGYLARRYRKVSQLGIILDPLMDKFFVFFVLGIFIQEGRLEIWQCLALISRDFAVLIFGLYLALKKTWNDFQFRSIWAGKITTTLQFFVLLSLTFHYQIPNFIFGCFIILGILALVELYFIEQHIMKEKRLHSNRG